MRMSFSIINVTSKYASLCHFGLHIPKGLEIGFHSRFVQHLAWVVPRHTWDVLGAT